MVAKSKHDRSGPFRLGDKVKFHFGVRDVVGTVTEILGPIAKGRDGAQMVYRVEFPMGGDEPLATELPAEELERAA